MHKIRKNFWHAGCCTRRANSPPRTRNPIGPEGLAWAYMVDLAKTALPQATRKTRLRSTRRLGVPLLVSVK